MYLAFDFAMSQPMDVVWWQLFKDTGEDVALDEIREWMQQREQAIHEHTVGDGEIEDETVVLKRMTE
ncbi:MAG: hypothetical protein ACRDTE_15615 [Pseudonocardiaceae bacterium]